MSLYIPRFCIHAVRILHVSTDIFATPGPVPVSRYMRSPPPLPIFLSPPVVRIFECAQVNGIEAVSWCRLAIRL